MKVEVGDKVYIPGEKHTYTVQARDERYIIFTKRISDVDVDYFIVDLKDRKRAPDDSLFRFGYQTRKGCEKHLKELQEGKIALSSRRSIDLDIDIE